MRSNIDIHPFRHERGFCFLFHPAFQNQSAQDQPNNKNRDREVARVRFVDQQRDFNRRHHDEGGEHQRPFPQFDRESSIGRGCAEIGGDRADDTNSIQISQTGHVFDGDDEQHRHQRGQQGRGVRNAPVIQFLENLWQLAVARHEELDRDKIDNRGVGSGEKQQTKNNTDDDGEKVSESRSHGATDKDLAHITQHVIAHAFRTWRVHVAIHNLQTV